MVPSLNKQFKVHAVVLSTSKRANCSRAKGIIGVKYATDRVGAFTKTVTVTSNADGSD
jgi:hypothetical protein